MEFSRQEYRSRLSFPPPGDLPNPGIEPMSHTLQAYSLPSEPPGKPRIGILCHQNIYNTVHTNSHTHRHTAVYTEMWREKVI